MRKVGFLFLLGIVSAILALPVGAMTVDEALKLWAEGDFIQITYDAAGQAKLEEAMAAFKTALGVPAELDETNEEAVGAFVVDPANKTLVNKLSQAYYTLTNNFLDPKETNEVRRASYLKGRNWGFKSLRMNPGFVALEKDKGFAAAAQAETDTQALYWSASNWLRYAQFNKLEAVLAGVPPKAQAMSFRTLELDHTYMMFGPYRSLGAYYAGLPAGLGQDLNQALFYFCKLVSEPTYCADCTTCPVDPSVSQYFENRTFFAEFYLMEKKLWADAARILQTVLDEPIGTKYALYNAMSQENARKLLEKVNAELKK